MLLITPQEVLSMAFMPREAISPESIKILKIDIAEQQYILPRFGDTLFEEFAVGDHRAFVDNYIKPALAFYVRASIIDDLSIQITDKGAIVYGESYSSEKENTTTSTSKESEDSTGKDTTIAQVNTNDNTVENSEVYASVVESQSSSVDDSLEDRPITNVEKSSIENSDADGTISKIVEETTTGEKDSTEKRTKSKEQSDSDAERHSYDRTIAATPEQRRALVFNALSDANILVAKAVRYVERHAEEFPSYEAMDLSKRIFF